MAEDQEDDDIVIDFSKIGKMFGKKKDSSKAEEKKSKKMEEPKTEAPEKTPEEPQKEEDTKEEEPQAEFEKEPEKPTEEEPEEKQAEPEKEEEKEEAPSEEPKKEDAVIEKKPKKTHHTHHKKSEPKEETDDDDDDITIDFSKISGLFGKKKKGTEKKPKKEHVEKEQAKDPEEEDDDEGISIDFSKIKGMFKGSKKESKESEEDDEVQIDWAKTAMFAKKYAVFLLILIPIILSITFRVQPAYLPVTDDWATDTVFNYFRGQVSNTVNQQYPNLPQANKDRIIEEQFRDLLGQQGDQIDQQIATISQQFKEQLQDDTGQTYLLAIDPYFWERLARNVVENGHAGDKLEDGKVWDDHMLAPLGREMPNDVLHAYVEAWVYRFVRIFNRDIPLKNVAFYVPVLLATLAVIPAFYLGRRLGGNVGGLFAGVLIAVHSQFLTRTAAGFADTDAYSVMLPLFIVWTFVEAFEAEVMWKKATLTTISGFLVGLFAFSWTGAWYIFDIILGSVGIYLVYLYVKSYSTVRFNVGKFLKNPAVRNTIFILLIFFVVSGVFVTVFRDFDTFTGSFIQGPLAFSEFKDVASSTVWPNVYTTVAEQNPSSLPGVIGAMGGRLLFFLAIAGALLAVFKKDKKGHRDIKMAAILIIWMAVSTYAAVRGVRFSLLIVPAFAVGFGLFVGITYQYLADWTSKELKINKTLVGSVLIILFGLLMINPIQAGWNVATHEVPSMNDGWFRALDKIKQASPEDAIINSWWDFGHWFKNIADRQVTFDGTSQNTPQAHWIGKVLLTDDEDEAIGILRMLDCGANSAFDELLLVQGESLLAIQTLYKIIPVHDREDAKAILEENGLSGTEAEDVLQYSHCDPPQDYFIASEDMVGKSGVWAHFGSWNFTRATMYNKVNDLDHTTGISTLQELFDLSDNDAQSIYYDIQTVDPNQWIAPWPSYASGLNGCSRSGDVLSCGNGIQINMSTDPWEAFAQSQGGRIYPKIFAYPTKTGMEQVVRDDDKIIRTNDGRELGATLVPSGNSYQLILMSPELSASMFTRLFYLDAHGLKHFKLFTHETTITGGQVYVYNVSWEGGEMNLVEELRPKNDIQEGYTVSINYIGYDEDGNVFDSTIKDVPTDQLTGDVDFADFDDLQPFSFTVGANQVIAGMDQQIRDMTRGEEKLMEIPPELAYGLDPAQHPLGNKTLFFKVRVEDIS